LHALQHKYLNQRWEHAVAQTPSQAKIWPVNYVINVKVFQVALQRQSQQQKQQRRQQPKTTTTTTAISRQRECRNCVYNLLRKQMQQQQ